MNVSNWKNVMKLKNKTLQENSEKTSDNTINYV